MKELRRKQITAYVASKKTASMEELVKEFGVSMNTIRTDVAYLVHAGALNKIYGGVEYCCDQSVAIFTARQVKNVAEKKRIARSAAGRLQNGDCVFIDAGTTTMYIPDYINPKLNLTMVTANLYVINSVIKLPNVRLIVLPGELDRRTNSLKSEGLLADLDRCSFTKAFMGCSGVSVDGRAMVSNYAECAFKSKALEKSRSAFLLADSEKFQKTSVINYAFLNQFTGMISDVGLCAQDQELCERCGVPLEIV